VWNAESRTPKVTKKINHWEKVPFVEMDVSDQALLNTASQWWYDFSKNSDVPTEEEIQQVLKSFVLREEFLLTAFSAKKVDGKKLYEYARAWTPILKNSPMHVISCELLSYSFPEVTVRFEVWSGTYIRSLWFELGKALGRWWVLTQLRREKIGEWGL
jgi:tRNA pseudouridine55 synthase